MFSQLVFLCVGLFLVVIFLCGFALIFCFHMCQFHLTCHPFCLASFCIPWNICFTSYHSKYHYSIKQVCYMCCPLFTSSCTNILLNKYIQLCHCLFLNFLNILTFTVYNTYCSYTLLKYILKNKTINVQCLRPSVEPLTDTVDQSRNLPYQLVNHESPILKLSCLPAINWFKWENLKQKSHD